MMTSNLISAKVSTFKPSGYVSAANASSFEQQLKDAIVSQDYSVFLVDMSGVEFLDSAGLMALVSACRLVQTIGKRFSLCSIPPSVRIVFELTGLDSVFEIFGSSSAFEASFD
ncbi:MAG: STAS domain-containing protein [Chloroflexaceae bacterium]|nr:STAS domain-containing protein [Chloroflexaceae bacterium]